MCAAPRWRRSAASALTELEWLAFYLPRQGVQTLARLLPLAKLRDRLPARLAGALRLGLYPARVAPASSVGCRRGQPAWGEPAELDPARPVPLAVPRASVVMCTFGNLDLTRLCLASLQRSAGRVPFEVVVVDNASTDGTLAWLETTAARGLLPLRVIANRANAGFARATNQAAAAARGEILVFLNNDTVVLPGWLDRLVEHLEHDPTIGLVGPATNSCGNAAEVGTPYADLDEMARFAAAYTAAHAGDLGELAMLTLFCAAMPRALFVAVGGLDERYGLGMFEDDDLSEAVRRAGRRVVVARDTFVHHYGSAALSRLGQRVYLRLWWWNRRQFEQKWGVAWRKR